MMVPVHYIPHAIVTALLTLAGWLGKNLVSQVKQEWAEMKVTAQTTHKLASNHMAHLEADLKQLNQKQDIANEKAEKQVELLTNIDKGIAILVDRG